MKNIRKCAQKALILLTIVSAFGCSPTTVPPTDDPVPIEEEVKSSPTAESSPALSEPSPSPAKSEYVEFFEKASTDTLRVMSYNVNWDSIFPVGDPESHDLRSFSKGNAFIRVVQAIQPDIVCLQEINPERNPQQISDILNEALGLNEEQGWQAVNVRDNVIATRFDLLVDGYELVTNSFRPNLPQAAALVDLPDEVYGERDIYVVCAHFKASGSVADILLRQRQADMIMSNIRDLLTPGDNMDFLQNTPFVILGDFNVYTTDPATHLTTLLTGDIVNEDRYGEDFQPDWDATELTDARPSHNGLGNEFFTWRNDQGVFESEILDHIIYSDSVLHVENAFILNTVLLSEEKLDKFGLQENDVVLVSATGYYDHFPLVVDFLILK